MPTIYAGVPSVLILFWIFWHAFTDCFTPIGVVECCRFGVSTRSKLELLPHLVVISSSFWHDIGFQWRIRYRVPFIFVKLRMRPTPCDLVLWHCCCNFFNLLRSKLHKCRTNVLIQIPDLGCACSILAWDHISCECNLQKTTNDEYFTSCIMFQITLEEQWLKYVGVIRSVFRVSPSSTDWIHTTRRVAPANLQWRCSKNRVGNRTSPDLAMVIRCACLLISKMYT